MPSCNHLDGDEKCSARGQDDDVDRCSSRVHLPRCRTMADRGIFFFYHTPFTPIIDKYKPKVPSRLRILDYCRHLTDIISIRAVIYVGIMCVRWPSNLIYVPTYFIWVLYTYIDNIGI